MDTKYVVILTAPVEEDRCAMIALQLADKLNVSISKMTRLLSGRPGPLTKAIDKAKAEKLANLLHRLEVRVAVVAENLEDSLLIPASIDSETSTQKKTKLSPAHARSDVSVSLTALKEPLTQKVESGIDLSFRPDDVFAPRSATPPFEPPLIPKRPIERLKPTPVPEIAVAVEQKPAAPKARSSRLSLILLSLIAISLVVVLGSSYLIPQAREILKGARASETEPIVSSIMPSPETLLEKASSGDAEAQFELAWLYTSGINGKQSYDDAAIWLQAAAQQNHANAQYYLGLYYYFGHGLEQSYTEAAHWLKASAEKGVGEAQLLLGRMYLAAEGLPQNLEEARKWLYLADEQGLKEANLLLNSASVSLKREQFEAHISPLFELAQEGQFSEISRLVASGADINVRDPYGQTPLMYAISSQQVGDLKQWLELGADINVQTDAGWTSLMYAARDNAGLISSLLENGADTSLRDGEGRSAFDIALATNPEALISLQTIEPALATEPPN